MLNIKTELVIIDEKSIKDKIYIIRGKKVMIDYDLAKIYGYTTKAFNQQVNRNIERFDEDFRFELTDEEIETLSRSQNVTLNKSNNKRGSNIKYLPYAFTEEGIYMLMTVLKGEKAVKQSKVLIKIFKSMKDYLIENKILEQDYINNMVLKHDKDIKQIKEVFDEEPYINNKIFFSGQTYDAYSLLLDIFSSSKKEIIIIDNYASKELLDMLKGINKRIVIVSKNINDLLKKKYESQYKNVTFINKDYFHDRFIIIDKKILYHLGASFKDLGKKCFGINKIDDIEYIKLLLNKTKK